MSVCNQDFTSWTYQPLVGVTVMDLSCHAAFFKKHPLGKQKAAKHGSEHITHKV